MSINTGIKNLNLKFMAISECFIAQKFLVKLKAFEAKLKRAIPAWNVENPKINEMWFSVLKKFQGDLCRRGRNIAIFPILSNTRDTFFISFQNWLLKGLEMVYCRSFCMPSFITSLKKEKWNYFKQMFDKCPSYFHSRKVY